MPQAAIAAVGDTLREEGLAVPVAGAGTTFLQAKTANEVLKAQERRLKLQQMNGKLVDRSRAETLVFRLAREVECIGKGKARTRYEYGVKTSFATTNERCKGG